ncbi:MAG: tail-specific protease, partial [Deltaproteobacteria bacterium]|nr:tail-specific protease [Deltaproteobacteria bacterium]
MRKSILWSFLLIFSLACNQGATAENSLQCEALPPLMSRYLQNHITYHHLSGELQDRTVENYLRRIDSSKVLLLASEADEIRVTLRSIFAEMRFGNCSALSSIQSEIIKHNKENAKTIAKVVSAKDFKVDPQTTLIIDPEKRGFPKTKEEQRELLEKLAHFQISNYESADTELEEAKEKLIHRYELFTKRAKEKTTGDLYANFLNSFALALDPHSSFFSRDDLEDFRISMGLSLEGIGVALTSRDGYSVVEKVIPGGATDRTKALKPQDKIIAVAQD